MKNIELGIVTVTIFHTHYQSSKQKQKGFNSVF